MKPLTIAEALAKVRKTFIEEQKPQCSDWGCYYWLKTRPHGCAVGCLLPIVVRLEMPFGAISDLIADEALPLEAKEAFSQLPIRFLSELQSWHDNSKVDQDGVINAAGVAEFGRLERKWLAKEAA